MFVKQTTICGRRDIRRIDNVFGAFDKAFVYCAYHGLGFLNIANSLGINEENNKKTHIFIER